MTDVADERAEIRQPEGELEEECYALAQESGRMLGENYPNIWAPDSEIAEIVDEISKISVEPILPPVVKMSGHPTFWLSVLLWFSGFVILIHGVSTPDAPGVFWIWLLNTTAWAACLYHAYWSSEQSDRLYWQRFVWLRRVFSAAAYDAIGGRRVEAHNYDPETARAAAGPFVPAGPAPMPQPFGVSHEGAERLVAQWMKYLGAEDAHETSYSGDGGVDVSSLNYIAQVKNYAGTVDVAAIRELAGVASTDGRKPLFFTSGQYASGALEFARRARVGLFIYDAVAGSLQPANELAERIIDQGL